MHHAGGSPTFISQQLISGLRGLQGAAPIQHNSSYMVELTTQAKFNGQLLASVVGVVLAYSIIFSSLSVRKQGSGKQCARHYTRQTAIRNRKSSLSRNPKHNITYFDEHVCAVSCY